MAKISLRDYQRDAVKFSLQEEYPNQLFCMRVGCGKTVCAMFSLRALMKAKLADKAIVACTKSSVEVFKEDFRDKAGIDVELIETEDRLIEFLKGKSKVCLIKHSMFEKAGNDSMTLKRLEKIANSGLKVVLAIDEAHKIQNPDGVTHEAFQRMDFIFNRIMLYTATPYMSSLEQLYGLIHLIYPDLWKSKRAFMNKYIDEITIKDPRTYRVVRKEIIRFKNLQDLRKTIEPFTFFYYPPIPIEHVTHTTTLDNYDEYIRLCKGILRDEDKEKIEKAESEVKE